MYRLTNCSPAPILFLFELNLNLIARFKKIKRRIAFCAMHVSMVDMGVSLLGQFSVVAAGLSGCCAGCVHSTLASGHKLSLFFSHGASF